MHKFVFRLQTKLDISTRQEQLAKEQLALKLQERDKVIDKINANLTRLATYENSIRTLPFKEGLIIKEYLPLIRAYIQELQMELVQAEERIETARTILLECKKETKALTKLREKEWKRYLYEINLEEQKEIDEIAINNHFRSN